MLAFCFRGILTEITLFQSSTNTLELIVIFSQCSATFFIFKALRKKYHFILPILTHMLILRFRDTPQAFFCNSSLFQCLFFKEISLFFCLIPKLKKQEIQFMNMAEQSCADFLLILTFQSFRRKQSSVQRLNNIQYITEGKGLSNQKRHF